MNQIINIENQHVKGEMWKENWKAWEKGSLERNDQELKRNYKEKFPFNSISWDVRKGVRKNLLKNGTSIYQLRGDVLISKNCIYVYKTDYEYCLQISKNK